MGRYDTPEFLITEEENKKIIERKNESISKHRLNIKGKEYNTVGELKEIIKSNDTILKLEDYLSEDHFFYLSHWFFIKKKHNIEI